MTAVGSANTLRPGSRPVDLIRRERSPTLRGAGCATLRLRPVDRRGAGCEWRMVLFSRVTSRHVEFEHAVKLLDGGGECVSSFVGDSSSNPIHCTLPWLMVFP